MTISPLLQVKNLTISLILKNHENKKLVKGINFEIQKGEILGLVGESGSGKSLTSLALLKLLPNKIEITDGEIIFGESQKNILTLSESEIRKVRGRKIAMVFQEPMSSLNPLMKCGSQVDEMLKIHSDLSKAEIGSKTKSLFDKVKLPNPERIYNAYPHELSGGQLQRVMIAMALSCSPDLLIADECTTALDVTVQKEVLLLLKDINDELGISILFISHDLEVIAEIADRVMVMKLGEMVEVGQTKSIFNEPKHPYTQQLISSKPPTDIKLEYLPKPDLFLQAFSSENFKKVAEDFILKYRITKEDLESRKLKISEADPILQIKELNKSYTTKKNFWGKPTAFIKAVNNVSFDLKYGEILGLVGESGCGKSTLSKSICRLIEPDSGEIIFEENNILSVPPNKLRKLRKEIQYIFQDPYSSLNPRHTIGYAIQEPMKVHSILKNAQERKEKTLELLEIVGLSKEHYSRYPHEFSGGQRQRICIARSLSLSPKLLICDEIVSALDVSVQAQVLNLLINLRKKFNLSMVFVSHDLSIVKFISDRMLVMNKGEIIESGWSDELFDNPQNEYTKTLFEAIPGKGLKI